MAVAVTDARGDEALSVGAGRFGASVLLLVAVWLLAHPYEGLTHDARLYTLQALALIHPGLGEDLFLAHGSQSAFTLFPALHAAAIRLAGLEAANIGLFAAGHALWVAALLILARQFARGPLVWILALAVAVMPTDYGGIIFSYAEPFVSPRLFSEAAVLLAFALLLSGRPRAGVASLLAALALHPLMALPAAAAMGVYLTLGNVRWLYLVPAAALGTGMAALAGLELPSRLFQTMDAVWFEIVAERNFYLFPLQWDRQAWLATAAAAALTATGAIATRGFRRRAFLAALLAGIGGIAVSIVGGDWLRSELIVQLQLWRTVWLLELASIAGAVLALVALRHRPDRWIISGLILVALFHSPMPELGAVSAAFGLGMTYGALRGRLGPLHFIPRAICASFIVLCLIFEASILGYRALLALEGLRLYGVFDDTMMLASGLAGLIVLIAALRLLRRMPDLRPGTAYVLPLPLLLLAALSWDQRTAWVALVESGDVRVSFNSSIPQDSQVYWPPDAIDAWVLLGRPSYVSVAQGAGVLFNRGTALDYRERIGSIAPLSGRVLFSQREMSEPCEELMRPPTAAALVHSCSVAPGLDALVLPWAIDLFPYSAWTSPAPRVQICSAGDEIGAFAPQTFYAYSCADILDTAEAAAASAF